jgi:membrane protein YdbS with pleckstrin-like domain
VTQTQDQERAETSARRMRGWASLYAVAFLLVVIAGGALALEVRSFFASTRLLWVSSFLSVAAIVVAVLSVLLPRRT